MQVVMVVVDDAQQRIRNLPKSASHDNLSKTDTNWVVVVRCLHVAACRRDFSVELASQGYGQALYAACQSGRRTRR
jgi:hypothetical protein